MKLLPENKLAQAFKSSVIDALTAYTFQSWMIDNGHGNQYNYQFRKEAWTQVYTLLAVVVGSDIYYNSSDAYLAYRDELLEACAKYFVSNQAELTEKNKAAFKLFVKWMSKGTEFTEETILKRMHISQYAYGLKERGIWKDDYAYPKTEMSIV